MDMLCPPLEETGNPVTCYPVAGYPLGCKVSWEPTQEGTGDPSPENVRPIKGRDTVKVERCGENLLNIKPFNKSTKGGITYEYVPDGGIHISGTALTSVTSPMFSVWYLPPGKYYGADSGEEIGASIVVHRNGRNVWLSTKGTFAILAGDVIKFWCLSVNSGKTVDNTLYPYIIPGTTAHTAYAPYIGQTATLTLPRTIYGGTVDAVTGEGQERWKLVTLDGTEEIKDREPKQYSMWLEQISYSGICSHFKTLSYTELQNHVVGVNLSYTRYAIFNTNFSSLDEFKRYIREQFEAGTPIQICHTRIPDNPNPTFTAEGGVPIKALSGVNTVITDADSVTVTGRADPIKRITDLEDAVASMT